MVWNDENLIKVLRENGVVVMPTDTLYGIVGLALNKNVVERIYSIRKRNPNKPCIILIGDINELEKFSIALSKEQKEVLEKDWPAILNEKEIASVSAILDCQNDSLFYLHRGTNTLAFRVPASLPLRELLLKVGPLLAPSANIEGLSPSKDIPEAKNYFGLPAQAGNSVDLYIDGGIITGKASKLIKLYTDGSISLLRI